MNNIAKMRYDYESESSSLSNNTIQSLSGLSVTDLKPSELGTKFEVPQKTKANVENPARQNLDIIP